MQTLIDIDGSFSPANTRGFGINHVQTIGSNLFVGFITDLGAVEVHISTDAGATWTQDVTRSEPNNCNRLSMTTSELGDLFVYYAEVISATSITHHISRRDPSGIWTHNIINLNEATTTFPSQGLTIYSKFDNSLWFIRTDDDGNIIKMRGSSDKGITWSGDSLIFDAASVNAEQFLWDADIDMATGNIHIWLQVFNKGIQVVNSNGIAVTRNSGGSLPANMTGAALAIDSAGNWYGAYQTATDIGVLINAGFSTVLGVATKAGMISIGIDGGDNVFVLYTKTSDNNTYYQKYNGATWETEVQITTGTPEGLKISAEKHVAPGSNQLQLTYGSSV